MARYRTEKELETAILSYLNYLPGCFAWKNNSTGIYDPVKKVFRKPKNIYAINGVADVLGSYRGKLLAIEVKLPTNKKRNPEQTLFLKRVIDSGGIAFYATSLDEVKEKLSEV
jgi:penicillin-binding protein-related factor A (putative recombinase)